MKKEKITRENWVELVRLCDWCKKEIVVKAICESEIFCSEKCALDYIDALNKETVH